MAAVQATSRIEDREAFKYALAATLVKNNAHWRSFETVFEVYFSLRGSAVRQVDDDSLDPESLERPGSTRTTWMGTDARAVRAKAGRGAMRRPDPRRARRSCCTRR